LEGDVADVSASGFALLVAGILLLILPTVIRRIRTNLFSCMLLTGVIIGSICADTAWAVLVLTYILFEGLHALVALHNRLGGHGLMRRRGMVVVCVLVLASGFSLADKQRFLFNRAGSMHRADALIKETGLLMQTLNGKQLVASQWPGRTMLATRHGALPLPPLHQNDPDTFLRQMHGVSFLVYDHHDAKMKGMNRQVAGLSNRIHTEAILPGGVILRLPIQ